MSARPQGRQAHGHHVSSVSQLIGIFVALLVLTGITIAASRFNFGEFDVWVALGIAGVKAFLVAAYYMHLRYDHPLHTALLVFSVLIVVLFLGVSLSDVLELLPEVEAAPN